MKTILIAMVCNYPHVGGKSSHIRDLCAGLEEENVQHRIVSLSNLSWRGNISFLAFRIFHKPFKKYNAEKYAYHRNCILRRAVAKDVLRLLKKEKFDFVSLQDAYVAGALQSLHAKINVPVTLTMHTYFGIEEILDHNFADEQSIWYQKELADEEGALLIADRFVAVDQRIQKHICDTLKKHKLDKPVYYVENFVNTDFYREPTSKERIQAKNALGCPKDAFVIACARRLVEKNGVWFAAQAMTSLQSKNAILLIGGDGPEKKRISEQAMHNGMQDTIQVLGALDSRAVRQLYWAADASCVPSITLNGLQEATSISAIEAMACGLPTIVSNIGGLAEMIQDEENGLVVPEQDERALAMALRRLWRNPKLAQKLKKNGRAYVVENHSHLAAAREYYAIFEGTKIK